MEKKEIVGKDVRTLFKVGSSLVMTIPDEYVKAHNLAPGDKVDVLYNEALHVEKINAEKILEKVHSEKSIRKIDKT